MKQLYTIFIFLMWQVITFGQVNEPHQSMELLKDQVATFHVHAFYEPQLKARDEAGVISIAQQESGLYEVTLTPDEGFIGTINFRIEAIPQAFPPQPEYIDFSVKYIKSFLETKDDFVSYAGSTLEIFPLANDTSSVSQFMVNNISQVLHGQAEVTDSNSIIYNGTSEDLDVDYVVYSAIDSNGVYDVGTVYIRYEPGTLVDYKENNYQVAKGQKQYILLDGDSFTPTAVSDKLTQVNDFTFAYTGSEVGRDTLDFIDGDKVRKCFIEILERDINSGNAKDDLFYTAINTPVTFDVYKNDNSGQFPIIDYSPELSHLGGGKFSYTPVTDDSGLQFFSYTVDYGSHTETAEVRILVKNFNPVNDFTYELKTLEGTELVIDYEVPLSTYYFNVVAQPNFGTVEYFESGEVGLECDELQAQKSVVYTPINGFVGMDEFDVEYCASENADCVILKVKVNVKTNPENNCLCVNDCIWAGDANGDGKVSTMDMLEISRNLGAAGPARDMPTWWTGVEGSDYQHNSVYDRNEKYMDANGDGRVDMQDLVAVKDNYGKYYRFISNDILGIAETPFFYLYEIQDMGDYDQLKLDFYLGTENIPVVEFDGITFNISFDADVVDSASVKLDIEPDAFFVSQSPFVAEVLQPEDGNLNVVIAKSNRQSSTGYGKLASLSFIIEDEVIGINPEVRSVVKDIELDVKVNDIICQASSGFHYALKPIASAIRYQVDNSSDGTIAPEIYYFPNPATNHISFQSQMDIKEISLVDIMGRVVKRTNHTTVDVSTLDSGLYLALIKSDEGVYTRKVEIIR